jgi:hypothetical protein
MYQLIKQDSLSRLKTLDWSVETLGRECSSTGLGIHLSKPE